MQDHIVRGVPSLVYWHASSRAYSVIDVKQPVETVLQERDHRLSFLPMLAQQGPDFSLTYKEQDDHQRSRGIAPRSSVHAMIRGPMTKDAALDHVTKLYHGLWYCCLRRRYPCYHISQQTAAISSILLPASTQMASRSPYRLTRDERTVLTHVARFIHDGWISTSNKRRSLYGHRRRYRL